METSKQEILTNFGLVAVNTAAYYRNRPEPTDPVYSTWLEICQRLASMLDTLPPTVSWENHVQILDMFMWVTPEIAEEMQEQNHPFYEAWVAVKEEHGL